GVLVGNFSLEGPQPIRSCHVSKGEKTPSDPKEKMVRKGPRPIRMCHVAPGVAERGENLKNVPKTKR
ncbi:hypothetical protein KI387_043407, partial [Taxus chinensis]